MIGIKNSKKGYKFSYSKMVTFSASFSILVGTLFFIGGGGEWLENAFSVRVGLYEGVEAKKIKMWMKPEDGYLSGSIIQVHEEYLEIKDFNDKMWTIDIHMPILQMLSFLKNMKRLKS